MSSFPHTSQRDAIPTEARVPRFYTNSFGLQWTRFRTTQLDSVSGLSVSRDRLLRCLGAYQHRMEGRTVLEVGCGAGRFTEILLTMRPARLVSVDLSEAVFANAETCPPSREHAVVRGDALRLPFRSAMFDGIVCLGMIQHTPSPEATLRALWQHLRPGGWFVFDHYTGQWADLRMATVFRWGLKRLPAATSMRATDRLVRWLLPLHQRFGRRYRGHLLLSRLSPIVTHVFDLPELTPAAQYEWSRLDTYDALTDWYKHRRSAAELDRVLRQCGAVRIDIVRAGNGLEVRCEKPTA